MKWNCDMIGLPTAITLEDGWTIYPMRKVQIVKTIIFITGFILSVAAPNAFAQAIDPTSEGFLKNLCENKNVSISCWKLGERFRTLDRCRHRRPHPGAEVVERFDHVLCLTRGRLFAHENHF